MQSSLKNSLKRGIGSLFSLAGVKVVNKNWGPRGFAASFQRIAASGMRPDIVFDLGAAKGTWTEETRQIFPDSLFVLVDPLPENRASLIMVAKHCRHAHVISAAVGKNRNTIGLNLHGDQSSFLKSKSFSGDTIEVPVRPLDDIFSEVWPSDRKELSVCVKVDVQGYEMEVLKGAERTLESTDILLVEVSIQRIYEGNPLAHEVISHLGARGYCIYDVVSYVQRPHDRALAQVDLVFARETSPLMSYVGWR